MPNKFNIKEPIQIPAYFMRARTHKDGALGLSFDTQEMTAEAKVKVIGLVNTFGWLLYKESEEPFINKDIPEYDPEQYDQVKSPALRQRSVYFLLYKQNPEGFVDFESYYRNKMEKVINFLKEKLA
jgi:hypothetical protein